MAESGRILLRSVAKEEIEPEEVGMVSQQAPSCAQGATVGSTHTAMPASNDRNPMPELHKDINEPSAALDSDGTRAADTEDISPRTGQRVGPYQLTKRLGHGGMGVVYEAVHEEIGQRVAIKLLASELAKQPAYRRRFLREAQAGSKVRHPGLVQIFDYGTLKNGIPFILMEYLEGRLLRAYMVQKPDFRLSIEAALRISRQIAAALAVAHAGGIVHRDLKPENVILAAEPEAVSGERARVLDFGIAKFLRAPQMDTGSPCAQSNQPIGTPLYMSPEQCRSEVSLDGKSDVYSLGVLLYEMLCGRTPFISDPGSPMGVMYQHLFSDPRPPRQLRRDIPPPVEALLLRMLAKEPERRPNMSVVAAELEALATSGGTNSGHFLRFYGNGIRIAVSAGMLLLFLPLLFELYYFLQHHELWIRNTQPSMVRIPASDFAMGSTQTEVIEATKWAKNNCKECEPQIYNREIPLRKVHVSSFFIDTHEATNEEFAEWLNQQRNRTVDQWGRSVKVAETLVADLSEEESVELHYRGIIWDKQKHHFHVLPEMARLPVVNVTWDGASLYCRAQGKRLPTEAEWELAARGTEHRRFPWGFDQPGCEDAIFDWVKSGLICRRPTIGPVPVATTPRDRTPLGVHDLAGNVAEWVLDTYQDRYPACGECLDPVATLDPLNPAEAGRHVVRGGGWYREIDACRGAGRSRALHDQPTGDIGFRCVRPTKP